MCQFLSPRSQIYTPIELKPSKCTVIPRWDYSPKRADKITTLGGTLLFLEDTVHCDSCPRDFPLHMGSTGIDPAGQMTVPNGEQGLRLQDLLSLGVSV